MLQSWLAESLDTEWLEYSMASDNQLRFIWEQVISEQREQNQDLQQLNPSYLAGQALSAWRSLKRWQISLDDLAKAETGQLLSLRKWLIDFEKRLKDHKLSAIELELAKALERDLPKQPVVKIYAFIEPLPPLWKAWLQHRFERIEEIDYIQSDASMPETPTDSFNSSSIKSIQLCAAESAKQELESALLWAQSIMQNYAQARVAIIDVNLRDNLKATMRRAETLLDTNRSRFSRGISLSQEGPIQTALALLSLNSSKIDLALARHIVQSPLWGDYQAEYNLRAKWDFDLCALQSTQVSTSDFLNLIANDEAFSARLAIISSKRHRNKKLAPLAWADLFQEQLSLLGCFEHCSDALLGRWNDALSDFARLGQVSADMDITEALHYLKNTCSAPVARAGSASPGVAFLDTLEAAADYSHIWLRGMDNQNWPGPINLNPLLPVSLQIQHQLPHSQPQMETELTQRLIKRVVHAADHVVFSYSQFNDDLEQSPCAFISHYPAYTPPYDQPTKQLDPISHTDSMQWINCSQAPEVAESQREIHAGASLLKTMALSPFDAFVQWRLGAYTLDEPKIGLSALDRGNLVHNILEQLWRNIGDSDQLNNLDQGSISGLCDRVTQNELSRYQKRHGWLPKHFVELERQRLSQLAFDWLDFERTRDAFSVELTEEKLSAHIGGLSFKLRLDRLDRLANGELILIDYKTGQSLSRRYWLDMPPAEPQLPLYAMTLTSTMGTTPDALCFAKVRSDKMEFIGIGKSMAKFDEWPGIEAREDWNELMVSWEDSLAALATDFIRGDTRVFETSRLFGHKDALSPLHRFAEFEQLQDFPKSQAEG